MRTTKRGFGRVLLLLTIGAMVGALLAVPAGAEPTEGTDEATVASRRRP
ncbi:MAG: hypothetical protein ACR2JP_00695 [Acidimicrobiia bacterium]